MTSPSFGQYHEELKAVAVRIANETLGDKAYVHADVRNHVKAISDRVLEEARTITAKQFKIIVSTTISDASTGAGLVSHSSVFWDSSLDGVVTATHNTDKIVAVISIFGCAV
jgi:Arc/MetJ family transcription regulator